MKFGPVPPKNVPTQDPGKVLRMAERWQRAAMAQQKWAEGAKVCVDFFEGRQYTEDQIAALKKARRPYFKFNVIAPVVRLVLGYQRNNKTDITFEQSHDSIATEQVADSLNGVEKAIARGSDMEFVDGEVFLDGLISGRGWYDTRLNWESNDFGEAKTGSLDPFSVFPDPDADTYDLNESATYMQESKHVSIDEVEAAFGKKIADLARPWVMGQTPQGPVSSIMVNDEVTPLRYFGQREAGVDAYWDQFYALQGDFVDTYRKTLRILNTQHKIREQRNVLIDLETGDTKVLPVDWPADKIAKVLLFAEETGNPVVAQTRMVERIQWTTTLGDLILYDAPSFYERYTMTGYFPYFRRGMTRGMVDDLVDPQKDKNKSRNARIEIMSKTSNGGWKYHESSLTPTQKQNLKRFGSAPGFNLEWKGEKEPMLVAPATPPMGYERVERQDDEDIKRISGINEAALGEIETVQSGRALEARQRQAVISVQMYMDNLRRSKRLVGINHLGIIQNYYAEPRIYRITGEDGKRMAVAINQPQLDPITGARRIVNQVTVGKYDAVVEEKPLSATLMQAQFEEMMQILEKLGPAIQPFLPMLIDLILGMSSMPRKQEWIERVRMIAGMQGLPTGGGAPPGQPPAPGGPPVPAAPAGLIPPPVQARSGQGGPMAAQG